MNLRGDNVQKLTYFNDAGQMLVISDRAFPYHLKTWSGAGGMVSDILTEKAPYQDGETYVGSAAQVRDISITTSILGNSQQNLYSLRRELSRVFRPKSRGRLRYQNDFMTAEIEVEVEVSPSFGSPNIARNQDCVISLLALEPYWTDADERGALLQNIAPLFEFQLEIPEDDGIEMGTHSEGRIVINNNGDKETGLYFEFPGPVTDPRITNATTGEFIELITPLTADEVMIITTHFGNKRATIKRENGSMDNAFQYLNLDSTFFQLVSGENIIEFDAAAGSAEAQITIKYRRRYAGL